MSRLLLRMFLLAALCLGWAVPGQGAGGEIVLGAALQLKLADAFLAEGEYYRAVTEYKKLLILFPDAEQVGAARFGIGLASFKGGEYEPAAKAFAAVQESPGGSRYAAAAGYYEGICYTKLGRWEQAGAAFERVASRHPASEYAPRARLGKSLVAFDAHDLAASRQELERFLASYPEDARTPEVREALLLLDQEQPRRSPLLAGVLSALLPGAGYLYAGHYRDGAVALLVNGLFIAGTVVAINQENYAVAAIVGGIGLPFYVGNIYGAANAATKWNLAVRRELRGRLAVTLDYRF
jgi:tetratricopeptide (TPR) repeat protein